ncbi:hypothetical protein NBRC116595_00560 [Aliiglaciecola sp. NS0011-25]
MAITIGLYSVKAILKPIENFFYNAVLIDDWLFKMFGKIFEENRLW